MHLILHKGIRGKKLGRQTDIDTHTNIFIARLKGTTHDNYRPCFYNRSQVEVSIND